MRLIFDFFFSLTLTTLLVIFIKLGFIKYLHSILYSKFKINQDITFKIIFKFQIMRYFVFFFESLSNNICLSSLNKYIQAKQSFNTDIKILH